jgi:hypothetical protein
MMAGATSGKAMDPDIEGPGSIRLGLTAVIATLYSPQCGIKLAHTLRTNPVTAVTSVE